MSKSTCCRPRFVYCLDPHIYQRSFKLGEVSAHLVCRGAGQQEIHISQNMRELDLFKGQKFKIFHISSLFNFLKSYPYIISNILVYLLRINRQYCFWSQEFLPLSILNDFFNIKDCFQNPKIIFSNLNSSEMIFFIVMYVRPL